MKKYHKWKKRGILRSSENAYTCTCRFDVLITCAAWIILKRMWWTHLHVYNTLTYMYTWVILISLKVIYTVNSWVDLLLRIKTCNVQFYFLSRHKLHAPCFSWCIQQYASSTSRLYKFERSEPKHVTFGIRTGNLDPRRQRLFAFQVQGGGKSQIAEVPREEMGSNTPICICKLFTFPSAGWTNNQMSRFPHLAWEVTKSCI